MSSVNPEDPPIDLILEIVDSEMPGARQPKVLLFDIGGVCVSYSMSFLILFDQMTVEFHHFG